MFLSIEPFHPPKHTLSTPPRALWVARIYFMVMLIRIWCCSYLLQHGKWRQMINCIKGDVYHRAVHLSWQDLCERNLGQSSQVHLEDFSKDWNAMFILLCLWFQLTLMLILTTDFMFGVPEMYTIGVFFLPIAKHVSCVWPSWADKWRRFALILS